MNTLHRAAYPLVLATLALLLSANALAKTLTDQLLAELLEQHMPVRVYQQENNPWPGGNYKLEVFKDGKPLITSGTKSVHVQVPLKIVISGNASSELMRINLNCNTSFNTLGEIDFRSETPGKVTRLKSEITLPIPSVIADCGRMQLPIDYYLKNLVTQNKHEWELEIDREINAWLAQQADAIQILQ